jgi:hypothetical protein
VHPEHGGGVVHPLDHHVAVGAVGSGIGFKEGAEPVEPHDQRAYPVDGPDRGVAAPGGLARHLTDDVPVAAERQHLLVAVGGDGQDLHPAGHEDEQVGGGLPLEAHRGAGKEVPGRAEGGQRSLLGVAEEFPELVRRAVPVHVPAHRENDPHAGQAPAADIRSTMSHPGRSYKPRV